MNGLELLQDHDSFYVNYQIFKFSRPTIYLLWEVNQMFGFTNRDNKVIFPEGRGEGGRGLDSYIKVTGMIVGNFEMKA